MKLKRVFDICIQRYGKDKKYKSVDRYSEMINPKFLEQVEKSNLTPSLHVIKNG